jgi:hypothetical protein
MHGIHFQHCVFGLGTIQGWPQKMWTSTQLNFVPPNANNRRAAGDLVVGVSRGIARHVGSTDHNDPPGM